MQLTRSSLLALAGSLSVAACSADRTIAANPDVALSRHRAPGGFITAQPAQAEALLPQVTIKPIISSGDLMPGSALPWGPTPDGLGAYAEGGSLWLFANHELSASGARNN